MTTLPRWLAFLLCVLLVCCQSIPPQLIHEGTLKSVTPKFGYDCLAFEDGFVVYVPFLHSYQLGAKYRIYKKRGFLGDISFIAEKMGPKP